MEIERPNPLGVAATVSLSAWAKRAWRKYGPMVVAAGYATEMDGLAFEAFCESHSEYVRLRKACAKLKDHELTEERGTGAPIEHTLRRQLREARNEMMKRGAQFGLSGPADRQKLIPAPIEECDEFSEYE